MGEETPPPPSGSEGFALVAAEREDLLATQAEAPDYLNALDALEVDAIRAYAALKEKVSSAADLCQGAREQLQDLARQAWKMAFHADFDFDASELGEKAQQLKPEDLERFHNAWAKLVYDVKEVYQAIGFHRRQDNVSLRSFVTSHCLGFFSDLLETLVPDPVNSQADTSLRSACPFIIAEAAGRVSVGNGLPRDGHVVFSAFQGPCAYYWNGPTGESAAGKDNLKRLVLDWLSKLGGEDKPATHALLQGSLTVTGIMEELLENSGQLQIINGELEKVINKRREKMLQELRFVISTIDSAQVQTTAFEEKLVPRNASNQLLVSVLREILRAQHASASPDADQPEMAGGLALPEGGEAQQPSKRRIQLRLPRSKRAKAEGGGQGQGSEMEIERMQWSAPATLVLAGVLDGSGQACDKAGKCPGSSMVTKHAGFGQPAAIPKMEMCSTNQLLAEGLVEQKILVDKKASETAPQPEPELIPDLDPIDFAARRLFDGLASEAEGEETLLEKATTLSMPFKINSKTAWYNFRQLRFSRGRKRQQGLELKMLSKSLVVRSARRSRFQLGLAVSTLKSHPSSRPKQELDGKAQQGILALAAKFPARR
ncbi:unnamed protein product [Effrenium voratum]|uniref:Uncharacterized protein n=1 Tax=Effrenium voratum TaxID=2562239 RepID=A0AA36HSS9_9DINO|nr:unnamed protein product [Effrenium voratum]